MVGDFYVSGMSSPSIIFHRRFSSVSCGVCRLVIYVIYLVNFYVESLFKKLKIN